MWDDDFDATPAPVNNNSVNGINNSSSNGFCVGRGRGFGSLSSMSNALPEVGSKQTNNDDWNGSKTESTWQEDDWNETPSNNQQYSSNSYSSNSYSSKPDRDNFSNSYGISNERKFSRNKFSRGGGGGGGGKGCYNCGEDGHMSRDCPTKSNRGGGGGGGGRSCFKCGKEGHMSRDCTESGGGGGGGGSRACFKCGQEGHMSRDCTESGSGGGGGGSRACFKCGKDGHMSRDCTESGGGGGGGGGSRACFKCGQEGHMSRDCTESGGGGGGGSRACFKCGQEGHMSRDCTESGGGGGGGGSRACFKCGQEGHMSRDCTESGGGGGGGGGSRACFKCGQEGHMSRDCTESGGGGGDSRACFKCKKEGHLSKDCTEEVLGEDGKPRPPPYIPPEPTEDADALFQGVPTGINFSKYDTINVDVSGDRPPAPIDSFENSGLNRHLLQNVEKAKYTKPTPVQKYAIPIIMNQRDLMACAQTGSGKTAAFLLPMLHHMITSPDLPNNADKPTQEPWAVIVAPTRELVIQIGSEARKFAYDTVIKADVLYGGTSTGYQSSRIKKGCHLLAATPGRLQDFLDKDKVSFAQLKYLVLDEADRMLDMGFAPAIRKFVEHSSMPEKGVRQTLLFSATFPREIQEMAGEFLHNYLFLTVGMIGAANADVEQTFFNLGQYDKRQKLLDLLQNSGTDRTLVFVEQKRTADFIASLLSQSEVPTTSIHGDRLQREREEALNDFRTGKMPVLVATAVAARGLDIRDVRHVINYDLPQTIDEYVHRIGRTGRVGNLGKATSFFDPEADKALAFSLKKILIDAQQPVPDWLSEEANNVGETQFSGRGGFGSRDIRNKGRGRKTDSNDAFDNNFGSSNNQSNTFDEPAGGDDDCWD